MSTPFKKLICEHDFDNQLERYFSNLALSDIDYLYRYSSPSEEPCLKIDLDNCRQLSRLTIWLSGKCNIEIISLADSSRVIDESSKLTSINQFEDKLFSLIEYMKASHTLH